MFLSELCIVLYNYSRMILAWNGESGSACVFTRPLLIKTQGINFFFLPQRQDEYTKRSQTINQVVVDVCCEVLSFSFLFLHSSSPGGRVREGTFFCSTLFCCSACPRGERSCLPFLAAWAGQQAGLGSEHAGITATRVLPSFPPVEPAAGGQRYQIKDSRHIKHERDCLTAAFPNVRAMHAHSMSMSISVWERSAPVHKTSREIIIALQLAGAVSAR